jgi:hypothetical protein
MIDCRQGWFGALRAAVAAAAIFGGAHGALAFNITTHHYNSMRWGWNNAETTLTPANVASASFGLVATVALDEQVDAQPLVMLGQTVAGKGVHNVVYVATERNTLYAIDADSGAVLLKRNFGAPNSYGTTGFCNNNSGSIGISSTPVIDTAAKLIYLVTNALEKGAPVYRLRALNLKDLTDAVVSGGKVIAASHQLTNGNTYRFSPYPERQRAALLMLAGNIYVAFGSYCDFPNLNNSYSRGMILGYGASNLAPLATNELTDKLPVSAAPNKTFLGSIWMSGFGPASDSEHIFFVTGNSDESGTTYSSTNNLAESAIEMTSDLSKVMTFFTPKDEATLDEEDVDFGSGGITVLPTLDATPANVAVAAGKDGNMFLLNRASMGGYSTGANNVLGTYSIGGCWCGESYFVGSDGIQRVVSSGANLQTWRVVTSPKTHLVEGSWTQTLDHSGQDLGFMTTVSSNGTSNGIIWAVGRPDSTSNNAVWLYAFNANTGAPLVGNGAPVNGDTIAGYWPNAAGANANIVPVVTNGKVYVASYAELAIFGLTSGTKNKAAQPATSGATVELQLPPGAHSIYGTVASVAGSRLALTTRSGATIVVDTAGAHSRRKPPAIGDTVLVMGNFDPGHVLRALAVTRAKSNEALWGPDR